MKYVLSILILFLCFQQIHAQQDTAVFSFNKEGRLDSFPSNRILFKKLDTLLVTIKPDTTSEKPIWFTFHYSDSEKKYIPINILNNTTHNNPGKILKIKKQFAGKISLTLDNLEEIALHNFYMSLLGPLKYDSIHTELELLHDSLESGGILDSLKYPHYKELCHMIAILCEDYHPYEVYPRWDLDSNMLNINIVKKDYLRKVLLTYLSQNISTSRLLQMKMDRNYKNQWVQINNLQDSLLLYVKTIKDLNNVIECDSTYTDVPLLKNRIEKFGSFNYISANPVLRSINSDTNAIVSALWFNEGRFSPSLIGMTTAERRFYVLSGDAKANAALHDKLIDEKLKEMPECCTFSVAGMDSLITLKGSGSKIFMVNTALNDTIWGLNTLNDLRNTRRINNQFQTPVTTVRRRPQILLQYDGSKKYYSEPQNKWSATATSTDTVNVLVHNISAGTVVKITQSSQSTSNTSSFEDNLNSSLSGISGLVTASAGINLSGLIPTNDYSGTLNKINPPPDQYGLYKTYRQMPPGNRVVQNELNTENITEKDLMISSIKAQNGIIKIDRVFNFFFSDSCHGNAMLTVIKGPMSDAIADSLIVKYNSFLAINKKRQEELNIQSEKLKKIIEKYKWVSYLATITDRSLPPLVMNETIDSNAAYSSLLSRLTIVDSTRSVQSTLVEMKPNGKKTDTTKYVLSPSVRIGKKVMFMFSAGIAYTFQPFNQYVATSSSNQVSISNNTNQLSFVVGMHVYPWKLFLIDDSFLGFSSHHFWNRFSFYLGLGLPDPLQQYYVGAGLDLVPGLKLMSGVHFYENFKYQVVNNQITNTVAGINSAGPFISLNIDPNAFISVLGLFK